MIVAVLLLGVVRASGWNPAREMLDKPLEGMCTAVLKVNGSDISMGFGGKNIVTYQLAAAILQVNLTANYSKINSTYSTNNGPSARMYSCCCSSNSTYYLYGGINAQGTALGDLWKYNISTGTWTTLNVGNSKIDSVRSGCVLVCRGDILYVLGSNNSSQASHHLTINLTSLTTSSYSLKMEQRAEITRKLWDGTTEVISFGIQNSSVPISLLHPVATALSRTQVLVQTPANSYLLQLDQATFRRLNSTPPADCIPINVQAGVLSICNQSIGIRRGVDYSQLDTSLSSATISNWPISLTSKAVLNSSDDILLLGSTPNSTVLYVLPKNSCVGAYKECWYGWPICQDGYYGWDCHARDYPNSLVLYDKNTLTSTTLQCEGHGQFSSSNSGCACSSGYSGDSCLTVDKSSCKQPVTADYPLAICQCSGDTVGGINCQVKFCYNDCTNNGVCGTDGICVCSQHYTSEDCSILKVLINFSWTAHLGCLTLMIIVGFLNC